jgi:hypothetical protein
MPTPSDRDMWEWLALLNDRCDVKVSSARHGDGRGGYRTVWTVQVTRQDDSEPPIVTAAGSMLEALVAALEEAQENEWIK